MPALLHAFTEANALHHLGKLAEAGELCQSILQQDPLHAGALHLLGILASDHGDPLLAVKLIGKAIQVNPQQISYYNDLGNILKRIGSHRQAEAAYRGAIAIAPGNADAYFNLGNLLHHQQQLPAAVSCYQQAIKLSPLEADAHNNLGSTLHDMGRHTEAMLAFERALAISPAYAEAHFNLGTTLASSGKNAAAIQSYNRSIVLQPSYGKAYQNRGNAEEATGDADAAIASYRLALACAPGNREIRSNLALALAFRGDHTALQSLQELVDEGPSSASAHWNLGTALLLYGQYERGWQEYAWRWQWTGFTSPRRQFPQPLWTGEALDGAVIFLHAEQGIGDTLQFARFIPLVVARGGRVVLEVQPELWHLFKDAPGVHLCLRQQEQLPAFGCHCPLMSLPLLLGTALTNLPPPFTYAWALDSALLPESVPMSLAGQALPRVGVAWAGNPLHARNRLRSLLLEDLAPLFSIRSVRFVSLQKGKAAASLRGSEPPFGLADDCALCKDFADTARIIAGLDLVISVDTAVAHLAASMGKPVWLILPLIPDWRWGLNQETTPWYPSVRLFRRKNHESWQQVVERVAADLACLTAA